MIRPPIRLPLFLALLIVISPVTGGCDNTIDAFSEEGAYSIQGYLSLSRSRQFIRVKSLTDPVVNDTTRAFDAEVILDNRSTGTSERLRDSLIVFGDGTVTHNFWTDTPIAPDTEYRLRVVRAADRTITQATTVTPTGAEATVEPQRGSCLTFFDVTFRDAQRLLTTAVGLQYNGRVVWVDLEGAVRTSADGDPRLRFTVQNVGNSVIDSGGRPFAAVCPVLDDPEVLIRFLYVSPDWPGNASPLDTTRYTPTQSRDVENGLGFFAALRRDTLSVTVDTSQSAAEAIPLE